MGIGTGGGEARCADAARAAISSPLLEESVDGATGILLNITGGKDLGLFEVNDAAEIIQNAADPNANIIFGAVIDESMSDDVRVTVIGTGFDHRPGRAVRGDRKRRERTPRSRAAHRRSSALGAGDLRRRHRRPAVPSLTRVHPRTCAGVPRAHAPLGRQAACGLSRGGTCTSPNSNTARVRRTPLYDRHVAAGAKIVDFAGWEMPVQYPDGVRAEHMAVRERCGIFDVSHMGEIETVGARAPRRCLQRLLSNDVSKIPVGGAQYCVLCDERGGVLDDLFTYRLEPDRYLTVTNASNHERDLAWFRAHAGRLRRRRSTTASTTTRCSPSRGRLRARSCRRSPTHRCRRRMTAATRRLSGAEVLVCGTGYTGEDGVELLLAPEDAPALWDELLSPWRLSRGPGRARHAAPGGLLSPVRQRPLARAQPDRSGLGWCCREDTGFIGSEADSRRPCRACHS